MLDVCLCFFLQEEDFLFLQIDTKYLQKKRKTDISNTVRNIVEKEKQKVWQAYIIIYINIQT